MKLNRDELEKRLTAAAAALTTPALAGLVTTIENLARQQSRERSPQNPPPITRPADVPLPQ